MDRALKERIVGATVLVVFIVLVVPVFLDGPAEAPAIVSQDVTLPGQGEAERKRQTIVLQRDRSDPVPLAGSSQSEAPADEQAQEPVDEPAEMTARPAPAKAPARTPTRTVDTAPAPEPPEPKTREPVATSSTGMWAVQLGSFSNKANAERLADELRKAGYAAFLSQVQSSGQPLHRVRIGPQRDRDAAAAVAGRLAAAGHRGQVVPHP